MDWLPYAYLLSVPLGDRWQFMETSKRVALTDDVIKNLHQKMLIKFIHIFRTTHLPQKTTHFTKGDTTIDGKKIVDRKLSNKHL